MVGAVTGNVDGCEDDLPDIYNFIGNEKARTKAKLYEFSILVWVSKDQESGPQTSRQDMI